MARIFTDAWFWVAVIGSILWVLPRVSRRWRARRPGRPTERAARTDAADRSARPDRASGVSMHLVIALVGLAATLGLGVGAATVRPRSSDTLAPARQDARPPIPAIEPGEVMPAGATMSAVHQALTARHETLTRELEELGAALNSPGRAVPPGEVTALVGRIVRHRLALRRHLAEGMEPALPFEAGHEGMRTALRAGPGPSAGRTNSPARQPSQVSDSVHPPV